MCTTKPITSLEDLWQWKMEEVPHFLIGKPLLNYSERDTPKTLLCHDMKGGYLDEESADGCEVKEHFAPYIIHHWWYIDIFTYFSHNFITLPPVGWIDQAHAHGVLVLGTVITEWTGGANICKAVLQNAESVARTVSKLVEITNTYNFEGWLINMENEVDASQLDNLYLFLSSLQRELRHAIGKRSRVVWYDAVTVNGDLKWQNELNERNWRWFEVTDGIFLNYTWSSSQLSCSAARALARLRDVYVGVDCFGRGCHGGGGWNCHKAFAIARERGLSVALFAPGWVAETMPHEDIVINSLRFWDRLITLVYSHQVTTLPIETNFGIGFVQKDGQKYFNMSVAQLQPHFLASGAFPQSTNEGLVFPGQAIYRLWDCDLVLCGHYSVEAICSEQLDLVLWDWITKKKEIIEKRGEQTANTWELHLKNKRISGLGLMSMKMVVLRKFSFVRKLS